MVSTRSLSLRNALRIRRPYGGSVLSAARRAAGAVFPYAAAAVGAGAASYAASRTSTRRAIEPRVNTFQHDTQSRYRKKRMPRRKRRRWVSFVKKVRHIDLNMQPLQIYTQEGVANQIAVANVGNYWGRMCGGIGVPFNDEITQCFLNAYNLGSAAACAAYKLFIKSICLDVEITNNGSYPVILDSYSLVCRKAYDNPITLSAQYVQALGEVAATASGGTISATKTALTLFDAPNFCSYWSVLKKTEHIIGSGNTITLQMRIPSDRYIDGKTLVYAQQGMPKFTRAFFFTWHGQPSNRGASGAAQFDSTNLTIGWQTVVHYAVPPSSTTKEAGRTD